MDLSRQCLSEPYGQTRLAFADAVALFRAIALGDCSPPGCSGNRVAELLEPGYQAGIVGCKRDGHDTEMAQEGPTAVDDAWQALGEQIFAR